MAAPRKTAPRTPKATPAAAAAAGTDPTDAYGQTVNRTDSGRTYVSSNRFNAANVEVRGRELLALSPVHHVGPAPLLVPMSELDELIADLMALRDNPAELKDAG